MSSFFKSDLVIDTLNTNGDVSINGDLTVTGDTTTVSTTNTVVSDKLLELANGTTGTPSGDAGVVIERGSSNNVFIGWDESEDKVTVATGTFTGASTGDLSLTDAALKTGAITASGDISTTGEVKTAKVSFTDGDDAITIADGGGITANTSLTLASGATVTAINDEDNMTSNSATALATQQSIKAYVDSQTSGAGNMDNWVLEDDDGTEVTVSNGKEVKFIGSGLTTNFTDTDNGTDADPFDLTFTVNAAQTGITSVVNASLEIGRDADNRIKFGTDNQIIFEVDGGDNVIFKTGGEIEAASLDVSGDADIDGTLEADAITVGGTALNTVIAGVTVTNATNAVDATNAAHVTVSDNENTNEENLIPFIEDASATGNVGLESDGDFAYNPSTGTVTATIFKGNIDAVDGDFDGTLEADAITVGGTALNEFIQDTVGAMVSSNTETGITVTYEDGDGTLDFVLAAPTSLGTITQDTVTFTSTNANDPQVFIKNTTNDANGPVLVLENDRGSNNGADNDVCGIIEFKGTDDASAQTTFALVSATVKDASNGAEGGEFGVEVATHDGEMQFGLRITDGDAEDELDVEIGSGINSVTTAAGYVKGANGVLVPEGKSVHIETPMLASADLTATGITTLMTASEAIAQGDLVYVSGDGTIGKALSNDIAKLPAIGLAVAAINQNAAGAILLQGMFRNDAYGFTAGNRLYVHTNGTITATAPSGNNQGAQAIGVALEPDVVYFNPSMVVVEITA